MFNKFTLYTRKVGKKKFLYVVFRDPQTNFRTKRCSIDELNFKLDDKTAKHITNRYEATLIAEKALERDIVFPKQSFSIPKFNDFALSIWDYDTSDYIRRRNKEKPNSITKLYASDQIKAYNLYVFPYVDQSLLLSDFTPSIAENIKDRMLDEGKSSSTINKAMQAIRTPLSEAFRTGLIKEDIAKRIKNIATTHKERGIPTKDEIERLLKYLNNQVEKGSYERHRFLTVALAVHTGMRLGEIRGLHAEDINLIDSATSTITIKHAYNDKDGLKCPKGKKPRCIEAPTQLCEELLQYSKLNPQPDSFIFFSLKGKDIPLSDSFIRHNFGDALESIGVSKEEQKTRYIDFHSLRHFYTSVMQTVLTSDERRKLLGHQSIAMTDNYTHETPEFFKSIQEKREQVLAYSYA